MGAPGSMSWCARGVAVALSVPFLLGGPPAMAGPAGPAPNDLWAAQTGPTVVTLVWSRPGNVSEFRIFESVGGTFKQISAPRLSADSFTLAVRAPWGVRQYAIEAVFGDGSVSEKALFNAIRVAEAKPGPVPAPASVSAEQSGSGEVVIRWSEVPGASAFTIGRAVGTGGFRTLCRICPTGGHYVDRNPEPGAKHTYSVVALASAGASPRVTSNVLVPTGVPATTRADAASPRSPAAVASPSGAEPRPASPAPVASPSRAEPRPASPSQDEEPNGPRADVDGKVVEPPRQMNFPGVPAAHRAAMRALADRLWSIFVRNPALHPPIGFDVEPDFVANGLSSRHAEPFMARVGGYIHWYIYVAAHQRVERIAVADHAVVVVTNLLTMVLSDKWQEDDDGAMYYEPREVGRVGGYPQYKRNIIAVTDSPRPLWRPVPLERVLRSELAVARKNLDGIKRSMDIASSYDPAANLEAWVRDRPKRKQENDRLVEDTKRSDAKAAERMQRIFEASEQATEKTFRELAAHPERSALPPDVQARQRAQRQEAEQCIAALEHELSALSPAARTAPAYVAWPGTESRPLPRPGCSMTVDAEFPNAIRIVEPNHDFFDTARPRTEAQVVFVDFSGLHVDPPQQPGRVRKQPDRFERAYERLREGMDYTAFAELTLKR